MVFGSREELSPELQSALILAGSIAAGCLGALTGLGGGVVVVLMLVLGFGIELRLAVGASLIAVIATSASSSARFLKGGFVNLRVATLLELVTALGAIMGAFVSSMLPAKAISLVFCAVLFWSAWQALTQRTEIDGTAEVPPDQAADWLELHGAMPGPNGPKPYRVTRVLPASLVMLFAGMLSALVGIGAGVVKVVAMDRLMRMPFKASTTTSNFMIGVTGAASAGVYFGKGQVDPTIAAPVALGAIVGAAIGAMLLSKLPVRAIRIVFATMVIVSGIQMLVKTLRGEVG